VKDRQQLAGASSKENQDRHSNTGKPLARHIDWSAKATQAAASKERFFLTC